MYLAGIVAVNEYLDSVFAYLQLIFDEIGWMQTNRKYKTIVQVRCKRNMRSIQNIQVCNDIFFKILLLMTPIIYFMVYGTCLNRCIDRHMSCVIGPSRKFIVELNEEHGAREAALQS
jgi:hypothetical protein